MNKLNRARENLLERLTEASRDIPDWGATPNPRKWLDAIEAFIDAKIHDALHGDDK